MNVGVGVLTLTPTQFSVSLCISMPDNDYQPPLEIQQNELAAQANFSDTIESRNLAVFAVNIAILIYLSCASGGIGRHASLRS